MIPKTFFGKDFFMLLLYHILNLRSIYFIEEKVLCRGVFENNGKRPLPCSRIGKRTLFFNPRLVPYPASNRTASTTYFAILRLAG